VFELEEVTYRYPEATLAALDRVSLSVGEGELVVLAGLSASGKSTLLGIAAGVVPHFNGGTFSGRAEVCGADLRQAGPAQLAEHVGTLFQDPETQVLMASVRAELAFPLENRGHDAVAVARGVEEVALALGIEALLERQTATLSGGELQRVALGAALAGRPSRPRSSTRSQAMSC
jgi:energy-coupling factor transport system ATP-binding protein